MPHTDTHSKPMFLRLGPGEKTVEDFAGPNGGNQSPAPCRHDRTGCLQRPQEYAGRDILERQQKSFPRSVDDPETLAECRQIDSVLCIGSMADLAYKFPAAS